MKKLKNVIKLKFLFQVQLVSQIFENIVMLKMYFYSNQFQKRIFYFSKGKQKQKLQFLIVFKNIEKKIFRLFID